MKNKKRGHALISFFVLLVNIPDLSLNENHISLNQNKLHVTHVTLIKNVDIESNECSMKLSNFSKEIRNFMLYKDKEKEELYLFSNISFSSRHSSDFQFVWTGLNTWSHISEKGFYL